MSMGVYIAGLEMPTSCHCCKMCVQVSDGDIDWHWECCLLFEKVARYAADRIPGCPLVPVPPHGRLGDLDKQDVQIEALIERHLHGYTKSTWDFVCELRDILKRNRTIIEAEPSEEQRKYEAAVEAAQYCEMYEPTYDPETGAM